MHGAHAQQHSDVSCVCAFAVPPLCACVCGGHAAGEQELGATKAELQAERER